MNPKVRAKLVDVIAGMYSLTQLNTVVSKSLGHSLEYYVGATDLLTSVEKLITALEFTPDDLNTLLADLTVWNRKPALRVAIDAYYGAPPPADPYDTLMALDEPFVDRQILRTKLRDLFQTGNRRALVVRGPRASGKSYSRWLVEHVARSEGIEPVFVQLKDNLLEDIVWQVINDLSLPPNDFRDRMAQASTITKGFIPAFRGAARKMLAERWCLIFDSHDYDTVPKATRNFVDELLSEVANLQMASIWTVVLGHRVEPPELGPPPPLTKAIKDDILQVTQPDVQKFLEEFSLLPGRAPLEPGKATLLAAEIFENLNPPLDHPGMEILATRLREKIGL
jgi:hypothetical protein